MKRLLLTMLLFVGIISPASTQGTLAVTKWETPVFLKPDSTRTPLGTLPVSKMVVILESDATWAKVAFTDGSDGPRVGFVAAKDLVVDEPRVALPTVAESNDVRPTAAPARTPTPAPAPAPIASTNAPASPPGYFLSGEQVADAIAVGSRNRKTQQHGLVLLDQGQMWTNAMLAGSNSVGATTGFSVVVYTPVAWVRQLAARAAKEYRRLAATDLIESDRAPVLRVTVNPDTPTMVTANGMLGTSSVQHVVLRDEARSLVVQPIAKEETVEEVSNAMGGRKTFQGVIAQFPLDGLRELRGPKGDREFYITVIGATGEEKNFKVKEKHFERLPQ